MSLLVVYWELQTWKFFLLCVLFSSELRSPRVGVAPSRIWGEIIVNFFEISPNCLGFPWAHLLLEFLWAYQGPFLNISFVLPGPIF